MSALSARRLRPGGPGFPTKGATFDSLNRAACAGVDSDRGQTYGFPFGDTACHVGSGLALCKALPGRSQGTSPGSARKDDLARLVRWHLCHVERGQRVQQCSGNPLCGVFSRLADVDEQNASGFEQLFDLFGVVFRYLIGRCMRHAGIVPRQQMKGDVDAFIDSIH